MTRSPFPTPPPANNGAQIPALMLRATREAAAAALAGGMIAATGRPHSLEEALAVHTAAYHALFPNEGSARYERWKAEEDRLTKVYE